MQTHGRVGRGEQTDGDQIEQQADWSGVVGAYYALRDPAKHKGSGTTRQGKEIRSRAGGIRRVVPGNWSFTVGG